MDYYRRDSCAFNGLESGAFFSRSKRTVDDPSRGFCSKQQQPWSGPGRPSSEHFSSKNVDYSDSGDKRSRSRRSRDSQKRDKLRGSDRKHEHTTAKRSRHYSRRRHKSSKDYEKRLVERLPDVTHIHRLQAKTAHDRKGKSSVGQDVYSRSLVVNRDLQPALGAMKRAHCETKADREEDESLSDGELSSSSAEQPSRSSYDSSIAQNSSDLMKSGAQVCELFSSEDEQQRTVLQNFRSSDIGSPESSVAAKSISGSGSSQRISYAQSLAAELRKICKTHNNLGVNKQRTGSNGSLNSCYSADNDGKSIMNDCYEVEFEGSAGAKHFSAALEITPPETSSSACISALTFTSSLLTSSEKDQSVSDKCSSRSPIICSPDVAVPSATNMSFTNSAATFLPVTSNIQNSCDSSPSDR
jgi:hypothetical protein